ncbi:hypothetical protein G9A89_005962 [Geosiphon pyriformis]|nr:hypothetical protein G9A89_005962 [Geosiphon pyriformis]
MKHTLFDFTYGKTATLPINFTVETYPVQPINKENFQETLQKRAYTLLNMTTNYHLLLTNLKLEINGKFENKWDGPFYIHEILGNRSYKLRLDDKILAKVVHRNRLKHYHSRNNPELLIPQIAPVANHLQNYHPYKRKTKSHSENRLPRLLKQALEENLLIAPIDIPPNATIQQKLLLLLNEQNNEHTPIYKYFYIGKTFYE